MVKVGLKVLAYNFNFSSREPSSLNHHSDKVSFDSNVSVTMFSWKLLLVVLSEACSVTLIFCLCV